MATTMRDLVMELGGREWIKGAHHRVYVPVAVSARMIGLDVSYYNSGNVSGATLDGRKISNGSAAAAIQSLDGFYYDVRTDKFCWADGTYARQIARTLRERLAALVAVAVAS